MSEFVQGWYPDEIDERDFLFREVRAPLTLLPTTFVRKQLGPVLSQGRTPRCTAFAASSLKLFQEWREHRRYYEFDEDDLYTRCKRADGHPDLPGTSNRVLLEELRGAGIRAPVKTMVSKVERYFRIEGYVRLETVQQIREAIYLDGPVLCGSDIDELWERGIGYSGQIGEPTGKTVGGHAYVIVGWSDRRKSVRVKNSWGKTWGDGGYAWLPYSHFEAYPTWDAYAAPDAVDQWRGARRRDENGPGSL